MSATPIPEMRFEEALSELERVVTALEDGKVPLEDSIALYERGNALRARCEALLSDAEMKVQRIVAGDAGAPALEETGLTHDPAPAAPAAQAPAAPAAPTKPRGAPTGDDIPF